MLNGREAFHSTSAKRQVLIADDERINRELLAAVLSDEYDLLLAGDGAEALEAIRQSAETLSLVLLDLMMPVMSGTEVLRALKEDPALQRIPVIVITSDQQAEVECLTLGAIDFIPKPYPQPGVIRARVLRTIELFEDRQIINSTERDPLTGLYSREYFYRYAEQFDRRQREAVMDALVIDINHFHMINERFGTAYGNEVLCRIGERVRALIPEEEGIVCRLEADTFMVYCAHREDYAEMLETASVGLSGEEAADNRVRLRMGVYAGVDKNLNIERRFDRAKLAADTVKGSFTKTIGLYDSALHEKELYAEQLIEDFPAAIRERQFQVYYQPKFDIRPQIPVLASAEALVRWNHPTLGMISPGVFIPLFEENGLIQTLDNYVWQDAAAQIRDWKERFDFTVPVSVNVSRIDMYDPKLIEVFANILRENGLTTRELHLEITESAYTQDSEQIINTVHRMRNLGFQVEMDDFGTGYSSLNMISALPIDALKLDMQFIRNAFSKRKDTKILEVIIDIADYLQVPVIAEGVETEEQMLTLKAMGCDFVQGYYFSKPVPAQEYERFVEERIRLADSGQLTEPEPVVRGGRETPLDNIVHALSGGFETIYYVDVKNDHYVEFSSRGRSEDLQIENGGDSFFEDVQKSIPRLIWPEDQTRVALCMQKDVLLAQLSDQLPFSMTYRRRIGDAPVYYNLKAVRARTHDEHHIVIGVSNVEGQMSREEGPNAMDFSALARALSSDMETIYYVDTVSDTYMEFGAAGAGQQLPLKLSSEDFFGFSAGEIGRMVCEEDRQRVLAAIEKEALLASLKQRGSFTLTYRVLAGEEKRYYRLKAVWADAEDRRHIIIGVSDVDGQLAEEEKLEAASRFGVPYERIARALAADYFCIYCVDLRNDHFFEYVAQEQYQALNIGSEGDRFFERCRENIARVIHPDDVPMFVSAFTRENVLDSLDRQKTFTLTYRLMFRGNPIYVHMKVTRMEEGDGQHIVIGVSNVDEQIRREQEHARALRMAHQDALTGVKSKYAYTEEEEKINRAIRESQSEAFALAVCDLNGLKRVNDTRGHQAGDQFIQEACAIICRTFRHSPVYRVGGDEFVVLLRGIDFENRVALLNDLTGQSCPGAPADGALLAVGMSEYRPGEDDTMAAVFARADAAMYKNKKADRDG